MTLAEKIKCAREKAGLSQAELAKKLRVSRQAVTKWECEKGLPDVENLKAMARLFEVSVDYLLDENAAEELNVIKEEIDWERYPKLAGRSLKEDAVVCGKYPRAHSIVELSRIKKKSVGQKIMDWIFFLFTDFPDSGADIVNALEDTSLYYLVETEEGYWLVNVTKTHILSRPLPKEKVGKRIDFGDAIYKRTIRKIEKLQG